MAELEIDPAGSVTSAKGFMAGAVYAGIKSYGANKLDVGILASDSPCAVAATYTRNLLHSASVDLNREHLRDGRAQAVVVNSGVANSSTGERGLDDARRMAELAAGRADIDPQDVAVCSTGVIGHFLPMDKIEWGISEVVLSAQGGLDFARAIMTTDTRPKHGSVRFGGYMLGGCTKGSGMIHPNMATMLAFLTTDAPIAQSFLQKTLSVAVERSFNLVSVDGDTSPSDTVLLLANGAAGGATIDEGSTLAGEFSAALEALCIYLAQAIARDGEGATKLIEFRVRAAVSEGEARILVRLMATSYLLKSAVHGADPNWGRIVAVIGRSGVTISEPEVTVAINGHRVFEDARPTEFDPRAVADSMRADTVTIEVGLGAGTARATGWGCDLSADYVKINADYHT